MTYPQMISENDIHKYFNTYTLYDKDTKLKNIDSDKRERLNNLVDNYVSQNHGGDKKSAYNLKGKLKYKITQSASQNSSHMFGHFQVWCEKEQYRLKYEHATSTNIGNENKLLRREIADLKSQLNNTDTEDLSVEDKSSQILPQDFKYQFIHWKDIMDGTTNIDEQEKRFRDILLDIAYEVSEYYKDYISSEEVKTNIINNFYEYLEICEENCMQDFDISSGIINKSYEMLDRRLDALISSPC
tara:strand:+ start:3654 stop:4382 length:729 start_codon:yes stop_codon:yes gene_type:complete